MDRAPGGCGADLRHDGGLEGPARRKEDLSATHLGATESTLKRIEKIVGFSVVRGHGREKRNSEDPTLARRGLRRVCLRGGPCVPEHLGVALVRRVTGHTTTQIVLDHYFQPGREEFRAALMGAMPAVLTGEARAAEPPSGTVGSGSVGSTGA